MKKELTLQEIQAIEAKILKYLHNICVENQLTYYLYGGTLLGAIRHKGFIPWDDDIDIIVPRKDYARLLEILKDKKEYKMLSYEYVDDYYYPFAKVVDPTTRLVEKGVKECKEMGVYVDIFPLDNTYNNPILRKIHLVLTEKIVGLNRYLAANEDEVKEIDSLQKGIYYRLSRYFKSHTVIKIIQKCASACNNKNTRYMADAIWGAGIVLDFEREWFGCPSLVDFEGDIYYAPKNSDALLQFLYGDYMTPPPLEKRTTAHSYTCWKEI